MRSITEELNIISDLENQGYGQRTIANVITESIEDASQGFSTMKELLADLDKECEATEGTPEDECDEEGCPVL